MFTGPSSCIFCHACSITKFYTNKCTKAIYTCLHSVLSWADMHMHVPTDQGIFFNLRADPIPTSVPSHILTLNDISDSWRIYHGFVLPMHSRKKQSKFSADFLWKPISCFLEWLTCYCRAKKSSALCVPELSIHLIFSDFFFWGKYCYQLAISSPQPGVLETDRLSWGRKRPTDAEPQAAWGHSHGMLAFTLCRKPSQEAESSLLGVRER